MRFLWKGRTPDGKKVVLHRFEGDFPVVDYADLSWRTKHADLIRKGVILDVETTGLSASTDQIIELGFRTFEFNRNTGELLKLGTKYQSFQDPGAPLSDKIKSITGISDADVEGQAIDWNEVNQLLEGVDIIISHNASFDRPFVDRLSAISQKKPWGCSIEQIDWEAKGFHSRKLELLSIYHGFFVEAHRALEDAEGLLYLLTFKDVKTSLPYLQELLMNARKPQVHVLALQSPFESKDDLRLRGYRWNQKNKFWSKVILKDRMEQEKGWLEAVVYNGEFKGKLEDIPIQDRFKTLGSD